MKVKASAIVADIGNKQIQNENAKDKELILLTFFFFNQSDSDIVLYIAYQAFKISVALILL
jgi:hypothetical protein